MIVDEAHESFADEGAARELFAPARKGHCLITYHPTELCTEASESIDILIALAPNGLEADDPVVAATALFSGLPLTDVIDAFVALPVGHALLSTASDPGSLRQFRPEVRLTVHVRHWHKYATGELPADRRFVFRNEDDQLTGAVAANLRDLCLELARCESTVIVHHATNHDYSRWIRDVFRDERLAAELERTEAELGTNLLEVETARQRLHAAVLERYETYLTRSASTEGESDLTTRC